jgi:NAD(P)-dependent dehydrogenase (short-subunit alcohol dehydrogenase family)
VPASFEGKVAIVTGAAMGIGASIAERFAGVGARVVLVDVDEAAVTETAAAVGGHAVVGDIRSADTAARAVAEAVRIGGSVDVLVNNAAVLRTARLHELSEDDWDLVLDVNLKGPFLMTRAVVPAMLAAGGGAIVNIASISALITLPEHAAYCAAKGGLVQLTRQAALEYATDGIRVNAVAPGTVDTPLVQRFLATSPDAASVMADLEAGHPIGRIGTGREIADAVLFLASDEASFVTGACLVADGGYTIR